MKTLEELKEESPLSINIANNVLKAGGITEASNIIYQEIKKANLGNATTRQLMEELIARENTSTDPTSHLTELVRELEFYLELIPDKELSYKTTSYED